jgi:hypothetical protein
MPPENERSESAAETHLMSTPETSGREKNALVGRLREMRGLPPKDLYNRVLRKLHRSRHRDATG